MTKAELIERLEQMRDKAGKRNSWCGETLIYSHGYEEAMEEAIELAKELPE